MKSLDEFSTEELVSELKRVNDNPKYSQKWKEIIEDMYFRHYLAAMEHENPSLSRRIDDWFYKGYQLGVDFHINQPTYMIKPLSVYEAQKHGLID